MEGIETVRMKKKSVTFGLLDHIRYHFKGDNTWIIHKLCGLNCSQPQEFLFLSEAEKHRYEKEMKNLVTGIEDLFVFILDHL